MKLKRSYLLIPIVVVAGVIVLLVIRSLGFHLVKTDPQNGSNPNQYTAVSFMFNEQIKPKGEGLNQIIISPDITGKTTVGEKSVTFTPDSAYSANTVYTATLSGVMNEKGKILSNLKVSFTPQYINYSDLPKDIQQRLVSQTDTNDSKSPPYSASVIAIQGSSELMNHGVTIQQLNGLKTAFYKYFKSKKIEVRGVVLSNIIKKPHNPYSTFDTITFSATFDNKSVYKGRIDYSNLTVIRLYLYFPSSGALTYDSGNIKG